MLTLPLSPLWQEGQGQSGDLFLLEVAVPTSTLMPEQRLPLPPHPVPSTLHKHRV